MVDEVWQAEVADVLPVLRTQVRDSLRVITMVAKQHCAIFRNGFTNASNGQPRR
jgi:hypothetical protein